MKRIDYNEKVLAIDLVQDQYKSLNPFEIIEKAKEDLDIDIELNFILNYLEYNENFELESAKIEVGYNMNEYD